MWKKKTDIHSNQNTLDKLSDNGTDLLFNGNPIGGGTSEVSVSGRPYALFTLRGAEIVVQRIGNSNDVEYSFQPLDTDRYRRLFITTGSGGHNTIDIPDGTLAMDEGLVYNVTTNTLATKLGTWGNVSVSSDEYLLLYNNLGLMGGILSKYVVNGVKTGDHQVIVPKTYIAKPITQTEANITQSLTFVGNELWQFDKDINTSALYRRDPVTYAQIGSSIPHTLGYWNSGDYNGTLDAIVTGNGTGAGQYTDNSMRIYYNVSTWTTKTQLTDLTTEFIEIDLNGLNATGNNDYKVQAMWGDNNFGENNIVYIVTNNGQTMRKLMLGKGANNLGEGNFTTGKLDTEFNGSYKILNVWKQLDGGGNFQDCFYYNGAIYNNSKRSLEESALIIWKHKLLANGTIEKIKINIPIYDNTSGDFMTGVATGEGLTIKDGKMYCVLLNPYYFFTIDVPV